MPDRPADLMDKAYFNQYTRIPIGRVFTCVSGTLDTYRVLNNERSPSRQFVVLTTEELRTVPSTGSESVPHELNLEFTTSQAEALVARLQEQFKLLDT